MAALTVCYLVEGIVVQESSNHSCCSRGTIRSGLPDRMSAVLQCCSPLEDIVHGAVLDGRGKRWCVVPSLASTTAGLGGMEQRDLVAGRDVMDSRRAVALSSAMVESTGGFARSMRGP